MHKSGMWKSDTNNQKLPRRVPQKRDTKKYNIQNNIRMLLGRDCEVEKMSRFPRDVEVFEEW